MTEKVPALTEPPEGYADWPTGRKERIDAARQRAALAVNTELLRLYREIGRDILDRQAEQGWGAKIVDRLSHDLREAFPDFSPNSGRKAHGWPTRLQRWSTAGPGTSSRCRSRRRRLNVRARL